MKPLARIAVLIPLLAGAALAQDASVKGQVVVVEQLASGRQRVVQGKDLNYTIVTLEADGHQVPVRVPPERPVIHQKGAKFQPPVLAVVLGQTVDFPNDDDITHNVFSFSVAKTFDLGLYKQGVLKSVRFEAPGEVDLFCSIHSSMNGFIYIVPTHLYAITDKTGAFTINGVPPGKYNVTGWNRALPGAHQSLEVPAAGGTVPLKVLLGGDAE